MLIVFLRNYIAKFIIERINNTVGDENPLAPIDFRPLAWYNDKIVYLCILCTNETKTL